MEELRALIDFYTSPVGQRVMKKPPIAMPESMAAGQQWGQRKAQEILQRLIERGYEPAQIWKARARAGRLQGRATTT